MVHSPSETSAKVGFYRPWLRVPSYDDNDAHVDVDLLHMKSDHHSHSQRRGYIEGGGFHLARGVTAKQRGPRLRIRMCVGV